MRIVRDVPGVVGEHKVLRAHAEVGECDDRARDVGCRGEREQRPHVPRVALLPRPPHADRAASGVGRPNDGSVVRHDDRARRRRVRQAEAARVDGGAGPRLDEEGQRGDENRGGSPPPQHAGRSGGPAGAARRRQELLQV